MRPPERLTAALALARWRCVECQSDAVEFTWLPALREWVPVITHWPVTDGPHNDPAAWCPCLSGGPAARLASLDLLDALAAHVGVAHYDPSPGPWHRRQPVTA